MVKQMVSEEELKKVLKELRAEGNLARVEKEIRPFLRDVDPETLSLVEQELMEEEGFDLEDLRNLCGIHLRAIDIKREEHELDEDHPISILKAEHEIILDNLNALERIAKKIKSNISLDQFNDELKRLELVAALLLEAESHHQREERALFPRLEEHGIIGPPNVMRIEHEDLRARKRVLKKLLDERDEYDQNYLTNKILELCNHIILTLRDHIYKENNILYPLALRVIPENEWKNIREEFDVIGYCCFTPKAKVRGEHHC
ncbi:DUF438 domain-containing protein [Candidatus Bathyarchaeota archaeon]|nr:DUF438 domain-containing protein [Candidatus Bathyarchaeota archaeon]